MEHALSCRACVRARLYGTRTPMLHQRAGTLASFMIKKEKCKQLIKAKETREPF